MATIVLYGMTGCKLFWIKRIADMNYSTDQTQPNIRADPNYTLCLLSGFTRGLLLKICIHSGFTLGPFRVQYEFTRGLLLWSNLNTEMRSRPIFYLTILLSVIPPPLYIPNTHHDMQPLLSGVYSSSDWDFLPVSTLGLLHVCSRITLGLFQ